MAITSKWLVASGLVLVTSPLCFTACAQDYVDVEAERSGQTTPAAPATAVPGESAPAPYGAPASEPYATPGQEAAPARSYGMDSAPAGPAVGAAPPTSIAPAGADAAGSNVGTLFVQLQQLRQEVMRLNGLVEEQGNELRQLKSQSLERYVDLDRRVSALSGGSPTTPAGEVATTAGTAGGATAMGKAAELPGEAEAYRAAHALVRSQSFDQAVNAFKQFLQKYPDGKYAPNAHYWLGELYLVIQPPDPEASRQAFSLLLSEYPDNPKAPDAMFKLGKVYFLKGNRAKSKEYLDQVIRQYGNTNSPAVQMARDFLAENFQGQ